jgi:plasmid stabilization system protein ParE
VSYRVEFAPEAVAQLAAIEEYIVNAELPLAAFRYVDAIVAYCESLVTFPAGSKAGRSLAGPSCHPPLSWHCRDRVPGECRTGSGVDPCVFYGGQETTRAHGTIPEVQHRYSAQLLRTSLNCVNLLIRNCFALRQLSLQ